MVIFGDKCDIRSVDASEAYVPFIELITQLVEVLTNQPPTFFDEFTIEAIWHRNEVFMLQPIIIKPEYFGLGYFGASRYNAGTMI